MLEDQSTKTESKPQEILSNEATKELPIKTVIIDEVLDCDIQTKNMNFKGHFEGDASDKEVLLKMEILPLQRNAKKIEAMFRESNQPKETHNNDIYTKYSITVPLELSVQMVYPCPKKFMLKASASPIHLIVETPKLYKEVTEKYIASIPIETNKWIDNIFDGISESDRVLFKNDEWLIVKDYKQGEGKIDGFHFLAIAKDKSLRTLRDLTPAQIPLLQHIAQQGKKSVSELLKIPPSRIRVYFHYWPSFYQLHVHFNDSADRGIGVETERAHLIEEVLNNLKSNAKYYESAEIVVGIKENDPLFSQFQALGGV